MIYKITLFDANFPSCTSGTASFFTEDIDEFEHNYFSDENVESNQLEAQKQRYFRSKAGEIVTDYYSDAPELNMALSKSERLFITRTRSLSYTTDI